MLSATRVFAWWVCPRCGTVIRSEAMPTACYEDQGGCQRLAEDVLFLGPFPEGAKAALEIVEDFRKLRLEDGLSEPEAIDALDRLRDEPPEIIRAVLLQSCLLDAWPVGWRDFATEKDEPSEWEKLARWMSFEDAEYWLKRVVDTSDTNILILLLLAAQGHLAPLLKAIGPAVHVIPVSGRFSAGKSRCAEVVTYLGGGRWLASATVPALKSARKSGPILLGIDEGDEAEKDQPGIKAYLLASHDWGAQYLKFSEPGEKGRRELVEIPHGGPVLVTFRKKPWEAVASRAYLVHMEPSKRASVSDDGLAFRKLLGPAAIWLRIRCEEELRDKNALWAERRVHEHDFVARLDRVTAQATVLRQRDVARVILFIAELLGLEMTKVEARLTRVIEQQELESENAVIVEAIESDPLFQEEEVGVENLRLSVQKFLRDRHESVDLTRNRFADVLKEMEFSREIGPTWKKVRRVDRLVTVILPGLWRKNRGTGVPEKGRQVKVDEGHSRSDTSDTSDTTPYGGVSHVSHVSDHVAGPGEAPSVVLEILRGLCEGGRIASLEDVLRAAQERGVAPDRTDGVLRRMARDGDLYRPSADTLRLTESLP